MEERTTLLEKEIIEKPQTRQVPQQKVSLSHIKQSVNKRAEDKRIVQKNQINFFGGATTEVAKETQQEVKNEASPSVIETPNYDFIETLSPAEEKKVFKIEKQKRKKSTSPLLRRMRIAVFALLFGVLGSWTVYNAVELSNVVTQYNLKLDKYLLKLGTMDSASNSNDLFPTYPEDQTGASGFEQQSNWWDRFCNFIGGIFGG